VEVRFACALLPPASIRSAEGPGLCTPSPWGPLLLALRSQSLVLNEHHRLHMIVVLIGRKPPKALLFPLAASWVTVESSNPSPSRSVVVVETTHVPVRR